MSEIAFKNRRLLTYLEQLRLGRDIIRSEGRVLTALAENLDRDFCKAIAYLFPCEGCVIVCGMGKAGLVGQKIAATLASVGTRSHFLHPSEALHGDLGRVDSKDIVLMLSQSGETEEVVRLLPSLVQLGVPVIAITGNKNGSLAKCATVSLFLGDFSEADPLGLAPSSSTTAMMALGDALAFVTARLRGISADDFARVHPGGSLGKKLAKVEEMMQPLDQCRVVLDNLTLREVFVSASRPGRRTGAIMLIDEAGVLTGIFTDSDLARLFERRADDAFDQSIQSVMTHSPTTIKAGSSFNEAIDLLAANKISELPVIDQDGRLLGLIDITDVVGLLPHAQQSDHDEQQPPTFRVVAG